MRVYVSSTCLDLEPYRRAVISKLQLGQYEVVCMEHKPAVDSTPLDEVLRDVSSCDVYVGIFAWRYGFIPENCNCSITEMEYRKAVDLGIPRLIFLAGDGVAQPDSFDQNGPDAQCIMRLREELQRERWVRPFQDPSDLAAEVVLAIKNLEDSLPAKKAATRISGPVPEVTIEHFHDRVSELSKLRSQMSNAGLRVVLVCGRGGTGKTALITKLIRSLEEDWTGKLTREEQAGVNSVVFIQLRDPAYHSLDTIVRLIANTFNNREAETLLARWMNKQSIMQGLHMLFNETLLHGRRLIVLDNFETILDEHNMIREEFAPLRQFIEACLEFKHEALILATSRRSLVLSDEIQGRTIGLRQEISLDTGLPLDAAKALLRELDPDCSLGIQMAPEDLLEEVANRCGCIPRVLESLAGVLSIGGWTLEDFLADPRNFAEFLEHPERVLYISLPKDDERRVMEVLAVYNEPISAAGVKFILPDLPVETILNRFRLNHIASSQNRLFYLHPLDQQYAYSQIPEDGEDYSRRTLHRKVADYFMNLPFKEKAERTTLEDVQPVLTAIRHLLSAGDAEAAATLFLDSGVCDDLYWWGDYLLLIDMCSQLVGRDIPAKLKIVLTVVWGKVRRNLGEREEAKRIYMGALPLLEGLSDPLSEIRLLVALGDISYYLNDMIGALDYHRRAEELLTANPDPELLSENSGDLANALLGQGRIEEAQQYYEQALKFSRISGMRTHEGIWNGDLAQIHSSRLDDPEDRKLALSYYREAIAIARETRDARHDSLWNGFLGIFYCQLGELQLAESHLRNALEISTRIRYRQGIESQTTGMIYLYSTRAQEAFDSGDIRGAMSSARELDEIATETDVSELHEEAARQIRVMEGLLLGRFAQLLDEGQVSEAVLKGREFLECCSPKTEAYVTLGEISMCWGRNGHRDCLTLAVQAYGKAIDISPEDAPGDYYSQRANAHAVLGEAEAAIADYTEAIRRNPEDIGTVLSRAEVCIWCGHYSTARESLVALTPQLTTTRERALSAWLMCHACNLEGQDIAPHKAVLEEIALKGKVHMDYNIADIEPYLDRLNESTLTEAQIANKEIIQDLIHRIAE